MKVVILKKENAICNYCMAFVMDLRVRRNGAQPYYADKYIHIMYNDRYYKFYRFSQTFIDYTEQLNDLGYNCCLCVHNVRDIVKVLNENNRIKNNIESTYDELNEQFSLMKQLRGINQTLTSKKCSGATACVMELYKLPANFKKEEEFYYENKKKFDLPSSFAGYLAKWTKRPVSAPGGPL